MDRAWKSGARATPPVAPVSPSIGYPSSGDAGLGVPATVPGDWWHHMHTEELRNVIVAAGLTPDHLQLNQLLTAIEKLAMRHNRVIDITAASAPVLLDRFDETHVITRTGLSSTIWTQMVDGGIYEMSIALSGGPRNNALNSDWRLRPNATSYATQFFCSTVNNSAPTIAPQATRDNSGSNFYFDVCTGSTGEDLVATAKLYPRTSKYKYMHAQSADSVAVAMHSGVWANESTAWSTVGELKFFDAASGGSTIVNAALVSSTVRIRRIA